MFQCLLITHLFMTLRRQWVTIDKMRQFAEYPGEDNAMMRLRYSFDYNVLSRDIALDAEMLAEVSPRQKWKSAAQREGCKKAFEYVFGFIDKFSHKLIHFLS